MKTLSARDIRVALPHLDELVAEEGEILLTRHGRVMARILPVKGKRRRASHADLRALMPRVKTGSEVLVREDRNSR